MITKLRQNKIAVQTIYLFIAKIFGLVIGFISNMLLAKEMGADTFGIYAFSLAIISFLAIFFEFGYFTSISRLLANTHNRQEEKDLIGSSLIIVGIISFLFFITIFLISFFVDNIFTNGIGDIIRMTSVVSWSFVIPFYMELILKGSNHIKILSSYQLVWKLLFIILLFTLYYQEMLSPLNVLYALSVSCIISFFYFIFKLNPSVSNLKNNFSNIQEENKSYGIHIYFGRVIDVSTFQLDRLMIGYFIGVKDVGLYSLANAMANPINVFSTSLSSSKFKSFSNAKSISKNILLTNLVWIVFAIIGANSLGYIIINFYLGDEYQEVFMLLVLMSIAVGFQAGYQPYNAWLVVNRHKREILYKTFATAFINVIFNILLIPKFGAIGAAYATIISTLSSLVLYIYFYQKLKNGGINEY